MMITLDNVFFLCVWNLSAKNSSSLPLFVFRKLRCNNLHMVSYRSPGTDGGVACNDPPSFDRERERKYIYILYNIYIATYSTQAPQGLF